MDDDIEEMTCTQVVGTYQFWVHASVALGGKGWKELEGNVDEN
jgi:hypothetical protein